jgi:hypothetical protein
MDSGTQPFSSAVRWQSSAVRRRPIAPAKEANGKVGVGVVVERVQHEGEWRVTTKRRIGIVGTGGETTAVDSG